MKNQISKVATTVKETSDQTVVRYHSIDVVTFTDQRVILDTGGWETSTTKKRMNEASNVFNLGFHVYQDKGFWYVNTAHLGTLQFKNDKCMFDRPGVLCSSIDR